MNIQIDFTTGRCIGLGDQPQWGYKVPSGLDFTYENYNRWVCSDLNDIDNPSNWTQSPAPIDLTDLVKRRIAKGEEIKIRYLAENAGMVLTQEENQKQLVDLEQLIKVLNIGDLKTALSLIQNVIPENEFVLTKEFATKGERKESYVNELSVAVAQLFNVEYQQK